ncbi:lactate utilization protein [Thermodesulfobacteriota bacterium]
MYKWITQHHDLRLADLKVSLEDNNFEVFIAENKEDAKKIVLEELLPKIAPQSISWGGSMTFVASGLYDEIKDNSDFEVIDTYDHTLPVEESMDRRRRALLVDLFFTGTNAITEDGMLVNLDMLGNRIGGLTFGPKNVIVLAGQNKIVGDLEDAMNRIKNYVAPVNVARLKKKTPCAKTSYCDDCKSPDRICNTWTITEKSFPKGRVRIVLIKESLGF